MVYASRISRCMNIVMLLQIRLANRVRQKNRPADPADLHFVVDAQNVPQDFLRCDKSVGRHRILIFATDDQLALLRQATTWYVDATFKIVNEPFKQLFTIHAYISSGKSVKQVPLVFVLMSGRRKKHYNEVLAAIHELLSTTGRVKRAVMDFETALWRSFQECLPDTGISGCYFHYTQAIWRKVQNLG